jgi:peptidyl-prolyl cis-trans isomerase-like protein 2
MVPVTEHETAIIDEDIIRYERVRKKDYLILTTNYGPLNCIVIQFQERVKTS